MDFSLPPGLSELGLTSSAASQANPVLGARGAINLNFGRSPSDLQPLLIMGGLAVLAVYLIRN